jgi:hypothetical protein
MPVYFTLLFIVVLAAFLARKSKSKILSRCLLGIAFASMVLVAGLRDRTMGEDTKSYVLFFNNIKTFTDVVVVGREMQEYGYWIMNWLLHFVSDDYMILLFAIAMIVVGCYQKAIVEYSASIEISFFVFITMGFYLFFFNGARQGIACAIYSLAIGQILKRNFIKYVGYVLLAFLFHKTAIVTLPFFFLFNRVNTFKNNLLIFLIGCVIVLFMDNIVAFASSFEPRYAGYGARGEGGGYYMVGFSLLSAIFFFIFKNSVRIDRARYDCFLNIYLFSVMIGLTSSILGTDPSGFLRYAAYFNLVAIFMWPIVFKNLTDRLSRFVVVYLFVIFSLVFLTMMTKRFGDNIPYRLNPSLSTLFK